MRGSRQGWIIAIGTVALVVALSLGTVGVFAGDGSSVIGTDPEEIDTSAGETVEMEILINSQADLLGYGLQSVEYGIVYDEAVLSITDVEHGPYLGKNGDDVDTALEEESGVITVHQKIDPSDDGVTGSGVTATLTIAVDADAPPSRQSIGFTNTSARTAANHTTALFSQNGTVVIDGGGEESTEDSNGDGGVSVTRAEDSDDSDDDEDEPLPGFGVLTAIAAGSVAIAVRFHRQSSR